MEVVIAPLYHRQLLGESSRTVKLTKADIAQIVYAEVRGVSRKEADQFVSAVFDTMKEAFGRGEKIKIVGFGKFIVRDKKARVGRNPQTGEEIMITARRVLLFKPSDDLKNAVNGGATPEQ